MDEDLALVTPDLDGIPEDDSAEPDDASVAHTVDADYAPDDPEDVPPNTTEEEEEDV